MSSLLAYPPSPQPSTALHSDSPHTLNADPEHGPPRLPFLPAPFLYYPFICLPSCSSLTGKPPSLSLSLVSTDTRFPLSAMAPAMIDPPSNTVCVMGASGRLGSGLVERLLGRGYTVHAATQKQGPTGSSQTPIYLPLALFRLAAHLTSIFGVPLPFQKSCWKFIPSSKWVLPVYGFQEKRESFVGENSFAVFNLS